MKKLLMVLILASLLCGFSFGVVYEMLTAKPETEVREVMVEVPVKETVYVPSEPEVIYRTVMLEKVVYKELEDWGSLEELQAWERWY